MLRPSIFTFDGAGAAVADADIVMLGVPYDGTASYRRGGGGPPAPQKADSFFF
jgi:arginase family enzyme